MHYRKTLTISILALGMVFSQAKAQDGIGESLESMLESNAQLYLQPFVNAFSSDMNSGWYYKAGTHKFLGFDLSVKLATAEIGDDEKTFDWVLSENNITLPLSNATSGQIDDLTLPFSDLYMGSNTETATVFGDAGGTLVPAHNHVIGLIHDQFIAGGRTEAEWNFIEGDVTNTVQNSVSPFNLPDGFDVPAMPMPIAQATIGLPMGTELSARFFPEQDLGDFGTFSFYGGGLRLNLDQFIPIPLFPVDITAGAFYQQMKLGDIITATNMHYGLQVGKSLNLLIFGLGAYVDAGFDATTIDATYDAELPDGQGGTQILPVEFSLEADGGMRFGGGIYVKPLPFIYINAAYSQTPTNQVATVGLNIGMR